jgi:hypothetical protein
VNFGIVMRKVIRRGNFKSVADLTDTLQRFLHCCNETMARPFRWAYTGTAIIRQRPALSASSSPIKNHIGETSRVMEVQLQTAVLG